MQILIVEDDQRLARQLKKGLEEQGHVVSLALDGLRGLEAARQGHFAVIVLDVMLPGLDGFGVVKRLRSTGSKSPVLMLTARDSAEDIVAGLDSGADDYLTKPFSLKVLLARLRALARRKEVEPRTHLQVGDLILDPAGRSVNRGELAISLTRTEFALQIYFVLIFSPRRPRRMSRKWTATWKRKLRHDPGYRLTFSNPIVSSLPTIRELTLSTQVLGTAGFEPLALASALATPSN